MYPDETFDYITRDDLDNVQVILFYSFYSSNHPYLIFCFRIFQPQGVLSLFLLFQQFNLVALIKFVLTKNYVMKIILKLRSSIL